MRVVRYKPAGVLSSGGLSGFWGRAENVEERARGSVDDVLTPGLIRCQQVDSSVQALPVQEL